MRLLARNFSLCVVSIFWFGLTSDSEAGDWLGLLGNNRDGWAADDESVATNFEGTLPVNWKFEAGQGYAGAACCSGKIILYDREVKNDRIRCVKASNGEVIWQQTIPANYSGGIDSDQGPRCVPSINGNNVILYSAAGQLTLCAFDTGKIVWSIDLKKKYRSDDGYFGAGSTPLVLDKTIVVNVGGKVGGIVGFAIEDGKELWTATAYDASYASPIAIQLPTGKAVVVPTRLKTVLVNPDDGSIVDEVNFGQRGPTVNAATPILTSTNRVFLTASYGIGSLFLDFKTQPAIESRLPDGLSSQYASPICVDQMLLGSDGREDGGTSSYNCLDAVTGDLLWQQPRIPISHAIGFNRKTKDANILLVGINGEVRLIQPNRDGWKSFWNAQLPTGRYRPLPAIADGQLILRTIGSGSTWYCMSLPK